MEITKYRSQLLIALEQVGVHLRQAQNTLTRLGRDVDDRSRRLREVLRPSENHVNYFWNLLRQGQNAFTRLGRGIADKKQEMRQAFQATKDDFREALTTSRDAVAGASGKIIKFRSELYVAWGQMTARLQRGQNTVTRFGKSVADKPRKLQKALRARENDLHKLLKNSPDAIVVTDVEHRFVAANPKGLDLFGVSETNLRKFTIDVFLSHGQILEFQAIGTPLTRREERHGKCEIRRLDGSLRIAEYSFVANFVPFRHLYRFCNIATTNQYQPPTLRTIRKQPNQTKGIASRRTIAFDSSCCTRSECCFKVVQSVGFDVPSRSNREALEAF
jgi:PAS domain S-box-containing protein